MSDTKHFNPDANQTKRCRVCGEEINLTARKCIHCGSWQDWSRHLGLGTTVLSLTVALTVVIGWVTPIVVTALTPANSRLIATFQAVNAQEISVLVSNQGVRPGTITGVGGLLIVGRDTNKENLFPLAANGDGRPMIVSPGESVLVPFWFLGKRPQELTEINDCFVEYFSTDFKGSRTMTSVKLDRADLTILRTSN